MNIRAYCPEADAAAVMQLWNQVLGETYPVTPRVFRQCTTGRYNFEQGDAVVATDADHVVGFAILEIPRGALSTGDHAALSAVLVEPSCRRQGVARSMLTTLETHARALGVKGITAGGGRHRFWTGVPDDLTEATAFFAAQGYELSGEGYDLVVPLGNYAASMKYQHRLNDDGASVASATLDDLPELLTFQLREFPNWVDSMLRMIAAGDESNVLIVRAEGQVVGTIQTFTPGSRCRASANLVWEAIHGDRMGGYGAVGIGEAWRGRGWGAAMCEAAALHVEKAGATCAYIDWTGLVDFYARVGAKVWRRFLTGSKSL